MHAPRGDWRTNLRATRLRRALTPPERLLWSRLRNGNLDGLKFRRQRSLGPYILDFYCADARLCVEVDGQNHADRRAADARRDAFLRAQGVETLRFTVTEVMTTLDGVLLRIRDVALKRIEAKKGEKTE